MLQPSTCSTPTPLHFFGFKIFLVAVSLQNFHDFFFNIWLFFLLFIFIKKKLWHRYFAVNFAKFLGTAFLQNTSRQLLFKFKLFTVFSVTFLWIERFCKDKTLIHLLQERCMQCMKALTRLWGRFHGDISPSTSKWFFGLRSTYFISIVTKYTLLFLAVFVIFQVYLLYLRKINKHPFSI